MGGTTYFKRPPFFLEENPEAQVRGGMGRTRSILILVEPTNLTSWRRPWIGDFTMFDPLLIRLNVRNQ